MTNETDFTLYTKEGYQQLLDELAYLKDVRVPEIKVQLAEARSHGDLSENSEYDEARDAQAKCYARIAEVEELIKKEMDLYDVSYVTNIGMATLGELKESMKNNKSSKLSAKNE